MTKNTACLLLIVMYTLIAIAQTGAEVGAEVPYDSYVYNRWREPVIVPHSYVPDRIYSGSDFGKLGLNSPQGMFVHRAKSEVYIADTGNNRILRLNSKWELLQVFEGFKAPSDVFVSDRNQIYIADTGNSRVVVMDMNGKFINIFGKPESDLVQEDFIYSPLKIVADKGGRIYVIAQGVNKGLIELDKDGIFKGYFGASKVAVNMTDYLWKFFSTNEQRKRMQRFVPTVYSNIAIDSDGFLMVTTNALTEQQITAAIWNAGTGTSISTPIRRLNPKGDNILHAYDWFPPVGEIRFGSMYTSVKSVPGPSSFADIVIDEFGIFHVLDTKRGRIFSYDPDSILLDVFGGLGHRKGLLQNPKAIELLDEKILVLDSKNNSVTAYRLTDYGRKVQTAIRAYYSGHYEDSLNEWLSVRDDNVNFEWAYWGIGNSYYRNEKYKEAMEYFRTIRYPGPYSRAFKFYRKDFLEKHFGLVVFALVIVIAGITVLRRILRKKGKYDR